jgi:hypothetical protein
VKEAGWKIRYLLKKALCIEQPGIERAGGATFASLLVFEVYDADPEQKEACPTA